MRNKGDTEGEYRVLLARLLPQIQYGSLAFVIQDNKMIQINVTTREPEVRNDAGTICLS